ncbi:zinc-binding dehydrogenase [Herbidospora sp. NEAU-GS84]|uniref:Zinc-binding dehydrogenase n=1 Tax=Herbidospora solisilvae TaxID=2696284 RepID=A0A7C9J352_9ACTN|nr:MULTISPECIES: NADP-dependent oxidoreductase [Herbidospora]NAS23005.1 zinc-binding dehydrogenase [Herbidospora solisilvae]GLX92401.1 NADPH:quinone reductase [Herbidospora sp. NBRC 101105]
MPKAYVYREYGGPEVEEFADLPKPTAGPGQVVVRVKAAGVNPADWKRRTGWRGPGVNPDHFPAVFGNEVAGVIAEIGPGVTGLKPGEAVFGSPLKGGYAEYAVLPASGLARKPDVVSFEDAATLPVAAATAYDGVRQLGLPRGGTLLITGIGGGVGTAAAQIARHAGVRVIGTADPAKRGFVESLGAAYVEPGPGVAERVRAVAPQGVDGIYDLVGGDALREVAPVLKDHSKLISAGDQTTARDLGGKPVARARTKEVLGAVADLVADGVLDPHVTATYPLDQADRALREVENGHAQGKIVITA